MNKQSKNKSMVSFAILSAIAFSMAMWLSPVKAQDFNTSPDGYDTSGVIIIADQFNNRVIEVDKLGNIVWQFGKGPHDFSAQSAIGANDAQRVGQFVLIAATGIPAGASPTCTNPNGCMDNRVLLVNKAGQIVWQYGQFKISGSGFDELNAPVQSTWLPNGHILITDQGNQRVIEVDHNKNIAWQYGTTGVSGNGY